MPGTPLQGYLAAAGSAVAFGSFAVPIKSKAVLDAKVPSCFLLQLHILECTMGTALVFCSEALPLPVAMTMISVVI